MRAHRSVVLLFSACLLSSAVIAQQDSTDKLPLDLFLGMVDAQGKQQCEQDRVKANAASGEREKLKAGLAVKLQCECLPAQLATLTGNPDLPKEVTQEEAMALITPLLERCAGLGMREFLVSSCPRRNAGSRHQRSKGLLRLFRQAVGKALRCGIHGRSRGGSY